MIQTNRKLAHRCCQSCGEFACILKKRKRETEKKLLIHYAGTGKTAQTVHHTIEEIRPAICASEGERDRHFLSRMDGCESGQAATHIHKTRHARTMMAAAVRAERIQNAASPSPPPFLLSNLHSIPVAAADMYYVCEASLTLQHACARPQSLLRVCACVRERVRVEPKEAMAGRQARRAHTPRLRLCACAGEYGAEDELSEPSKQASSE